MDTRRAAFVVSGRYTATTQAYIPGTMQNSDAFLSNVDMAIDAVTESTAEEERKAKVRARKVKRDRCALYLQQVHAFASCPR